MQLVVLLSLLVYLSSAICLGESIQALEKHYNQPLTTRYLMMGSGTTLLLSHAPSHAASSFCMVLLLSHAGAVKPCVYRSAVA